MSRAWVTFCQQQWARSLWKHAVSRQAKISYFPACAQVANAVRASAAAAHIIGTEQPCRVRLRLWHCSAADPTAALDAPSLTIPDAVLCSEMGVHFSACGRYLAACVACQVSFLFVLYLCTSVSMSHSLSIIFTKICSVYFKLCACNQCCDNILLQGLVSQFLHELKYSSAAADCSSYKSCLHTVMQFAAANQGHAWMFLLSSSLLTRHRPDGPLAGFAGHSL